MRLITAWEKLYRKYPKQLDKKIVVVASGDLSHKVNDHSPYGFHFSGSKV
jgi:aromatic ring-opening dioxygenase LigB subunit